MLEVIAAVSGFMNAISSIRNVADGKSDVLHGVSQLTSNFSNLMKF